MNHKNKRILNFDLIIIHHLEVFGVTQVFIGMNNNNNSSNTVNYWAATFTANKFFKKKKCHHHFYEAFGTSAFSDYQNGKN